VLDFLFFFFSYFFGHLRLLWGVAGLADEKDENRLYAHVLDHHARSRSHHHHHPQKYDINQIKSKVLTKPHTGKEKPHPGEHHASEQRTRPRVAKWRVRRADRPSTLRSRYVIVVWVWVHDFFYL